MIGKQDTAQQLRDIADPVESARDPRQNAQERDSSGGHEDEYGVGALGNAMVRVAVNYNDIAMDGDEGGMPERAAGEGDCQLRVETAHHATCSPATPHVRIDDDQYHEEQSAEVVDTEADNEDVDAVPTDLPEIT